MPDLIHHPPHYTEGGIEVWDAIRAWKLNYFLGNVVKYVARAGKKSSSGSTIANEDMLTDLRKAQAYLAKEIENLEGVDA